MRSFRPLPDLFDPSPRPPPTRAYKGRGVFFPAPIAVSFTAGRPPGRSSTRNDRPGRAPSLSQQSIRHPGARSPIQQRPHLRGQRGVAERLWQQMRAGVQDSPRHDRVAPIAGGEQYQQVRAVNSAETDLASRSAAVWFHRPGAPAAGWSTAGAAVRFRRNKKARRRGSWPDALVWAGGISWRDGPLSCARRGGGC